RRRLRGCLEVPRHCRDAPRGVSEAAISAVFPPTLRGRTVPMGSSSPPRRRPTGRLYNGGCRVASFQTPPWSEGRRRPPAPERDRREKRWEQGSVPCPLPCLDHQLSMSAGRGAARCEPHSPGLLLFEGGFVSREDLFASHSLLFASRSPAFEPSEGEKKRS